MKRKTRSAERARNKKSYHIIRWSATIVGLLSLLLISGLNQSGKWAGKWDGKSRQTVIVSIQEKETPDLSQILVLFSIEPSRQRAAIVLIPGNLVFSVPFGYGQYPAASVFRLGELDPDRGGGYLLRKSTEASLRVVVDGYVIVRSSDIVPRTPQQAQLVKTKLFSLLGILVHPRYFHGVFRQSAFATDMSIADSFRLWNAIRKLRIDQIALFDLEKLGSVETVPLPNGTKAGKLNADTFDLIMRDAFEDGEIRKESIPIEIVNATEETGLAGQFGDMLAHIGANVIGRTTGTQRVKNACLLYITGPNVRQKSIAKKLTSSWGCQIEPQTDAESSIADILVVLGEEFLK